jgi:hypothetical protein
MNARARVIFRLLRDLTARRKFLAAEQAWLAYRVAGCKSVADAYRGGSAQPVAFAECVVNRNEQHLKELASLEGFLRRTSSAQSPAHAGASTRPPVGLSRSGRILWQFEALLNDTFHSRVVSAHYVPGTAWNFACAGFCAPLSYWNPYVFTFADARHSVFHLSMKRIAPGTFGNYPILIRVKGHSVACDRAERKFLITYGDAVGLSLDCL